MPGLARPTTRLRDHRPEPSNLWIRHSAVWSAPSGLVWVDLARGGLGGVESMRAGAGRRFSPPVDVLYLPPAVDETEAGFLADWCTARELPCLSHFVVGETEPLDSNDLVMPVADLLAALLGGRLEMLGQVSPAATVVWPAIPGLTDTPELLAEGLGRLRDNGVKRVVPLAVELTPAAGRTLTQRYGEQLFESVFHSKVGDVREIARACTDAGMSFLPVRPGLAGAPAFERGLATELAVIAELWVASGESPARAQEFYRAAAWVEESRHDLAALVRDGNLGIVPSLSARVHDVIEELAAGRPRSTLRANLEERFAAPPR